MAMAVRWRQPDGSTVVDGLCWFALFFFFPASLADFLSIALCAIVVFIEY